MDKSEAQIFYEIVTWAVVIGINLILFAYAYWFADVATLMQSKWRQRTAFVFAVLFAGLGLWRMVAIVIYYESFTARLAIPISAALIWGALFVAGLASHRYFRSVHRRMSVSNKNWSLSDAVSREIVGPLLRKEYDQVSPELIQEHKTRSNAF